MLKITKSCLNSDCSAYGDKLNSSNLDKFCTKCGKPLFHVCKIKDCHEIIEKDTYSLCQHHYSNKIHTQRKRRRKINDAFDIVKNPKRLERIIEYGSAAVVVGKKVAPKVIKKI